MYAEEAATARLPTPSQAVDDSTKYRLPCHVVRVLTYTRWEDGTEDDAPEPSWVYQPQDNRSSGRVEYGLSRSLSLHMPVGCAIDATSPMSSDGCVQRSVREVTLCSQTGPCLDSFPRRIDEVGGGLQTRETSL
jgi:hypothetical protein